MKLVLWRYMNSGFPDIEKHSLSRKANRRICRPDKRFTNLDFTFDPQNISIATFSSSMASIVSQPSTLSATSAICVGMINSGQLVDMTSPSVPARQGLKWSSLPFEARAMIWGFRFMNVTRVINFVSNKIQSRALLWRNLGFVASRL